MWLWNKKQAGKVTKARSCSAFWVTQITLDFILEMRVTHQLIEAGLGRLVHKAGKGMGSGSGPRVSQGGWI